MAELVVVGHVLVTERDAEHAFHDHCADAEQGQQPAILETIQNVRSSLVCILCCKPVDRMQLVKQRHTVNLCDGVCFENMRGVCRSNFADRLELDLLKLAIFMCYAGFLPPRIEDYVGPDNPVRAIEAYVCSLDLAALAFRHADHDGGAGQPSYDPADLLKLHLYGYIN